MRRAILVVSLLLGLGSVGRAQSAAITAAMGAGYANGTISLIKTGPGGGTATAAGFDSSGNLAIQLPQGSQWMATVCPTTTSCYNALVQVTAAFQSISALLTTNQPSVAGACTGTATSSVTLGLYGTGPNETLTTCTSAAIGSGIVMARAGTLAGLNVTATHAGFNASSGVVTVLKNGSSTTITCTVGTGTACSDLTHAVAFVQGDLVSLQFTTQATEVLAGVVASVGAQ